MNRRSVFFTAPGKVEVQDEPLPALSAGLVLVQTVTTAISPGTELLLYRGQFPTGIPVDENIPSLAGDSQAVASPPGASRYPLKYGYSAVGRVIDTGPGVEAAWLSRLVFAFQPHTSHFVAAPHDLLPLPEGLAPEEAVFLPNMETAVNFLMDGSPLIGERVAVFGQGIVGLLTTALLARFPLASLVTLDSFPLRRQASLGLGAHASLDPNQASRPDALYSLLPGGADLVYELSGSPAALDQAIAATGFAGRVVIGSWYGQKRANLDLGGSFHRSRIRLVSSQVSTLAPEFSARWTKQRRFSVAWDMLRLVKPSQLVTQRVPVDQAAQAFQLLDQQPDQAIQVLLTYE